MKLQEISPNTLAGSFSNDLIIRKIWAVEELEKIATNFQTVYVLGSWFGNMGFILDKSSSINYGTLINVDIDREAIHTSKQIYKKADIDNAKFLIKDANKLTYRNSGHPNLVINTSVNNIKGRAWFDNIPDKSLVILQGRNNDPGSVNTYQDLSDFKKSFKFEEVLYAGKITLTSDHENFDAFMIIGIK